MRKQTTGRLTALILIMMLFLSGCDTDSPETEAPDQETETSLEDPFTGTTGTSGLVGEETEEITEPDTGDEVNRQKMRTELWYLALKHAFSDYEGQDEYQLSVCIDESSSTETFVNIYANQSKVTSADLVYNNDSWIWRADDNSLADYTLTNYVNDAEGSSFIMDGTVSKHWNEVDPSVMEDYIRAAYSEEFCRRMLINMGRLYEEETGGIEGEINASLYLTDYYGIEKIGLWVCFDGKEPVYMTVSDDYTHKTDATKTFPDDIAETAILVMDVELSTGDPENMNFPTVQPVTEFGITKYVPEYSYPSDGADYDGDGTVDWIVMTTDSYDCESYYLYGGNGKKTLLWDQEMPSRNFMYWIHQADVTGDGVPELVVYHTYQNTDQFTDHYVIWQQVGGSLKRITMPAEDFADNGWLYGEMCDFSLKMERMNDTQIRVTVLENGQSEVIGLDAAQMGEFWPAGNNSVRYLRALAQDDMWWYRESEDGELGFYATVRVGIGELTGRIVCINGEWTIRDFSLSLTERIVSDSIIQAEKDGQELEEELWQEALESAAVRLEPEMTFDNDRGVSYERTVYIPWSVRERVEAQTGAVFERISGIPAISKTYEGRIVTENGSFRWIETGETDKSPDEDDYNLVIHTENQVSLIGDPLRLGTEGDEDRLAAAELLLGAAMRYAAELHLQNTGTIGQEMRAYLYVVDSTYDLDRPEGEILLQMDSESTTPIRLHVSYDGSCREQATGYTLTVMENDQSYVVVEEAVFFRTLVTTSVNEEWKYSTWQAFSEYEKGQVSGEYGTFLDELQDEYSGELRFPAMDYDGDGLTDRIFRYEHGGSGLELYWFFGNGDVVRLSPEKTLFNELSSLTGVDLTGDGVKEYIYLTQADDEIRHMGIQIWQCTEDGLQPMPYVDSEGKNTSEFSIVTFPVKLKENTLIYEKIGISVEKEFDEMLNGIYLRQYQAAQLQAAMSGGSVADISIDSSVEAYILVLDLTNGNVRLMGRGFVGGSLTEVGFDMIYKDGVWVLTDFYE